jgi:hypothetical protein
MRLLSVWFAMAALGSISPAAPHPLPVPPEERFQNFDLDPGWEGINNRPDPEVSRTVVQDFGYSPTSHCVASPGEIGGTITPAARPASYGLKIGPSSFRSTLSASGVLRCEGGKFHVLLGFYNSKTRNEWRTPNTLVIRLQGRGDRFIAFTEYCTGKWKAGGDSPGGFDTEEPEDKHSRKRPLKGFPLQTTLPWSMNYRPQTNGTGRLTVHIGTQEAECVISKEHLQEGAQFDRFGIQTVVKSAVNGGKLWVGALKVNGAKPDLRNSALWDAQGSHETYTTDEVRPHGNFGYSATSYAGGTHPGEIGGLIFRGDCRNTETMAAYGDRLEKLDLSMPLHASGKIVMRQGVTDSAVLIGFYHSKDSLRTSNDQSSLLPACFLGLVVEGPSREGFLLRPMLNTRKCDATENLLRESPHIYPDGVVHVFDLKYDPAGAGGRGVITLKVDNHTVTSELDAGMKGSGTRFNRLGFVTTWIDGNGQRVFVDDLQYTYRPIH